MLENLNFQGTVISKTHDNAANIVKAVRGEEAELEERKQMPDDEGEDEESRFMRQETECLEGVSLRCSAHLLNLVVKKALKDEELQELLQKITSIVDHFNHATTLLAKLQDETWEKTFGSYPRSF